MFSRSSLRTQHPDRETVPTRERHLVYYVFRNGALLWEQPVISALLAVILYASFAATYDPIWQASRYAYFNYPADAFLHGQLHLRLLPWTPHDLSLYDGRYYLYWPPFPAVLLMPFVALFRVGVSDILFTLGIAGLNVALVALLLRQACVRGIIELTRFQRGLLVLFCAWYRASDARALRPGVVYRTVGWLCMCRTCLSSGNQLARRTGVCADRTCAGMHIADA